MQSREERVVQVPVVDAAREQQIKQEAYEAATAAIVAEVELLRRQKAAADESTRRLEAQVCCKLGLIAPTSKLFLGSMGAGSFSGCMITSAVSICMLTFPGNVLHLAGYMCIAAPV